MSWQVEFFQYFCTVRFFNCVWRHLFQVRLGHVGFGQDRPGYVSQQQYDSGWCSLCVVSDRGVVVGGQGRKWGRDRDAGFLGTE